MKQYLAIFDLDGTLFDTRETNYYAYKSALKPYGIVLDKKYFIIQCNGRHYTEFLPVIMGGKEYIEDVHKAKKEFYIKNLNRVKINVHLFNIIEYIKALYSLAIVTTASKKNTIDLLEYFGYVDLFDILICQEDVTRLKPDPQGFLMAMNHFTIPPDKTVIFEDSDVGIQAAKATGATVMTVNQF